MTLATLYYHLSLMAAATQEDWDELIESLLSAPWPSPECQSN
jgi:hypothetical protein